ncbi:hypothetical protein GCM10007939_00910 [Amylibacter marinus]|uniref:HTH tetR-type domain-containing protein n=1 Tax=Amylibacter marinus TaxID=1475483 RepID=A0ABQ5VRT2_9RHOB|nr:TetR/AcrR family transcriptional regulator [Amylibacter marinus]GLQ33808.1 hypothetical protein GCM10007939_00910 [Amylibacter marinus]
MDNKKTTKEKLLDTAVNLFWTRGYSNVSVRDITTAVGVDAALISRYYGSKMGLFEASLEGALTWPELFEDPDANILNHFVVKLTETDDMHIQMVMELMMNNINDPEVGCFIQDKFQVDFVDKIAVKIGGPFGHERAALFMASIIGLCQVRDNFKLAGVATANNSAFASQIRYLGREALRYVG